MTAYNRFGCLASNVVDLYPDTVTADYGSAAIIEEAIDHAVEQIANAMPEGLYRQISGIDLECVVRRATTGQTVCPGTTLRPLVAGSVRVWRGMPTWFQTQPLPAELIGAGSYGVPVDLSSDQFTVNLATGAVTLAQPLALGEQVYVSAEVDTASASYSLPSLARLAARGAAGELGARLYSDQTNEWKLVTILRQDFVDGLNLLAAGKLIPDEVRLARYWTDPAPAAGGMQSIDLVLG